MTILLRAPHRLIRRNLSGLERAFAAAGLAAILYFLLQAMPVYPPYWDLVILTAVFTAALFSPAAGYFLAVAVASYPIFSISVYVGVLYLAAALLAQRAVIHNLGAALLILSSPVLGGYYLAWLVPVLGGLWWGARGGLWIGLLAALWGLSAAAMAGVQPDWLLLLGQTPTAGAVIANFAGADSLETLYRFISPFAADTTTLLYAILQIAMWGLAGGLVGRLAGAQDPVAVDLRGDSPGNAARPPAWLSRLGRPWGAGLVAGLGVIGLLVGHFALAWWLVRPSLPAIDALPVPLLLGTATASVLAAALEALRDFFERPFPLVSPGRWALRSQPVVEEHASPEPVPLPADYPDFTQDASEDDELIMLELD